MQTVEKKPRARRLKKGIKEMYPVKKWFTLSEACSYMDMSLNVFQEMATKNGLSLSVLGKKKYYRVEELENLIEENVIIRSI